MTKIYNTSIKKKVTDVLYRSAIVIYIIYFILSPQAMAQQVQAPDAETAQLLANVEPVSLTGRDVIENLFGKDSEENTNEVDERVLKIQAYYARYNLPLADHAEAFVESADKYDIDWRLVAAIGFIESTGGKFACKSATFSAFGWGSCKISFDSYEEAIDVVSMNLGGHNPSTVHYYKDKNLTEVLYAYNSVNPKYKAKILRQMEIIESQVV